MAKHFPISSARITMCVKVIFLVNQLLGEKRGQKKNYFQTFKEKVKRYCLFIRPCWVELFRQMLCATLNPGRNNFTVMHILFSGIKQYVFKTFISLWVTVFTDKEASPNVEGMFIFPLLRME